MSTVPAIPPEVPESMTTAPPVGSLAPTIGDDSLYEVVDGQRVEKKMERARARSRCCWQATYFSLYVRIG